MNQLLKKITACPQSEQFRYDPELLARYHADLALQGNPDALHFARDLSDLEKIFSYCHQEKIPITLCGSRTSVTGSPVTMQGGLLINTEKMNRLVDIAPHPSHPYITAQPGIILNDLKQAAQHEKLFYPPDPTSFNEATLGGTLATNATGEDSYQYGSTRIYVDRIKVLLANGSKLELTRKQPLAISQNKGFPGYFLNHEPIDYFIGSEGTLGFIYEASLRLLPPAPHYFACIAFFPSLASLLQWVAGLRQQQKISPRCVELLDQNCLTLLKQHPEVFPIPEQVQAALYVKQEYQNNQDREQKLNAWLGLLETHLQQDQSAALLNDTILVEDETKLDWLRRLRHFIPAKINEMARKDHSNGGGKLSTDWWVPPKIIPEFFDWLNEQHQSLTCPIYMFGHIGNGHPHINYLTRNAEEKTQAQQIILNTCKRAVQMGGSVAGEHGLGKIKCHLLNVQHANENILEMKKLKTQFDPNNILGRGTLFNDKTG